MKIPSQEMSIVLTGRPENDTRKIGKEVVKPKNEQVLRALVARAIGSCNKQSKKWEKSDCLKMSD